MDHSRLRRYKGKGTFEFKIEGSCKENAEFVLDFLSNSKITVETKLLVTKNNLPIMEKQINERIIIEAKLNGFVIDENDDIGTISIEKLAINSSSVSSKKGEYVQLELKMICYSTVDIIYSDEKSVDAEIHYGLTNFVFSGCEYSVEDNKHILDRFDATVNNFNILFKKVGNYLDMENRLNAKRGCFVTSEAIVTTPVDNSDKARNTIYDVVELLSLATRNFVSPTYEDYFCGGTIFRTVLNPVITYGYNGSDNLIGTNPTPCTIKYFLETTYDKYQEYKKDLGLNAIISLYLISGFTLYTETKFMLMFVALESLLSNFKDYLKMMGTPIPPSLQKKTKKQLIKILAKDEIQLEDETIDSIVNSIGYQHTTFDDKLTPLLKKYNINSMAEDRALNSLRNKIVHNGKFPVESNSRVITPYVEYTRLIYFVDRILLSILGYKDKPFLNKHGGYKEEIL